MSKEQRSKLAYVPRCGGCRPYCGGCRCADRSCPLLAEATQHTKYRMYSRGQIDLPPPPPHLPAIESENPTKPSCPREPQEVCLRSCPPEYWWRLTTTPLAAVVETNPVRRVLVGEPFSDPMSHRVDPSDTTLLLANNLCSSLHSSVHVPSTSYTSSICCNSPAAPSSATTARGPARVFPISS